ncbi:MAG TPA: hypothetical protein VH252_00045 [Chthoniobacterales bacterium]|jgi:hypothetical protein|nr:hypothetical protein [Chthoniobacterales bacterium]
MDPFSYICILTSIVAGLAVTRLVGGLGQLIQTWKRTPGYWVHAVWMVNTLMTVIICWWVQYRWRSIEHWTLLLVLWLLVAPINLYLASALLFPNEQEGEPITNWRDHYFDHRRGFFILIAANFAIDLVDSSLKGAEHFWSLGPLYFTSMALFIVCGSIAAFTRSARYHAAFAVFYFVYNSVMLGNDVLRLM